MPQTPVRRGRRLAIAVAMSVLAHAAMLPFIAHDANFHMPRHPARQMVSLMATPHSALATRNGAFGPNTNAAGINPCQSCTPGHLFGPIMVRVLPEVAAGLCRHPEKEPAAALLHDRRL